MQTSGRVCTTSGSAKPSSSTARHTPLARLPRGAVGSGVGLGGAREPRFAIFLQPIGLALDAEDLAVVHQAVQDGGSQHGIALHFAPVVHGLVAGEDPAAALKAAVHELEQQVSSAPSPPPGRGPGISVTPLGDPVFGHHRSSEADDHVAALDLHVPRPAHQLEWHRAAVRLERNPAVSRLDHRKTEKSPAARCCEALVWRRVRDSNS